jgi:tRNA(Leu) C34 or U34 (ribose-2'-O)-methylase TrmL
MKVRVVLVEPQEGGNVGAAARVMKNFGWRDLVIAGPAPDAPDEKSVWWAAGAEDVLREVRYVATLDEALADVNMSVATTAVRARHVHEQLSPAEVAQVAAETLGANERLALVFGRETWLCAELQSLAGKRALTTRDLAALVVRKTRAEPLVPSDPATQRPRLSKSASSCRADSRPDRFRIPVAQSI